MTNNLLHKTAHLILVRHGQSEWNLQGLWTGWNDVHLSPQGHTEAQNAGRQIQDITIDHVYVSDLIRAQETYADMKAILGIDPPLTIAPQIKERDYGDLAGKNKWKLKEEYGEEQFLKWRRGWDDLVPGGESLKDVYNRVQPYFVTTILPQLIEGKNILIVAHGNSLRALVKYIEAIPDSEIAHLEIPTGEVYIYSMDPSGKVITKEIKKA